MEKIAINPTRLQWCMNASELDIGTLSKSLHIAEKTLELVMANKTVLSVNQLERIATFFKRSLLFFLDPNEVQEEQIYSPQFRTINNQKLIRSTKLRALIERIEKHRQVYIGLLEDLDESSPSDWMPEFTLTTKNIKQASAKVRQWLNLPVKYGFDDLRQAVENKGVMVVVSNGYNGQWQIDKNEPVRGFSLYYEILPIVVIKKQESKGAQAFTLMHELAHLLLHKESAIDDEKDFHRYQGKEKDANEFAGNLLIPDDFLSQINTGHLLNLDVAEYDNYLANFKSQWCVSVEAILVRLLINNKISQQNYQNYKNFKNTQSKITVKRKTDKIPRTYRHREPVNVFGRPFVYAVFDSLHNKQITLAKASTYLDNLKISDVRQLEKYV
ncbi:MAG: ImmA/IrrE family metallo-endopeptidase [Methylococcales bacterium]|jgi:Zn-dependent peptidase ImmA (M78 family)|nr:ImmA/IrrE family metallo-endopeptidase [Methylococcales bacterium]MBT7410786.1 ImmA/IrrE family metallo-endopeptidase [Methylococcales bacterium]